MMSLNFYDVMRNYERVKKFYENAYKNSKALCYNTDCLNQNFAHDCKG